MDTREISSRLHDILRTACRVRQPGPGSSIDAGLVGLDEVKASLRGLIQDLGDSAAPAPPPRVQASAVAFPEGQIAGTRATVQHRRRARSAPPALLTLPLGGGRVTLSARAHAEAHFAVPSPYRRAVAAGRS